MDVLGSGISAAKRIIRRFAPHPFGVALRAINLACGQVVELGLLSAGRSNQNLQRQKPVKGSRAGKAMVRPERFELPASWFVVAVMIF